MRVFSVCFLFILLYSSTFVLAQGRFFTRAGHISFLSSTPIEDIKADNRQVASVIDFATGEMVFSVLMRSFEFPKALMQEHFNENYIESDKYPKSTFKGKITNAQSVDTKKDGMYKVNVEGYLTIHGVTKPVKTEGTLEVKEGRILGKSNFTVAVADYNIQIPKVVQDNIQKTIEIKVDMVYEPFKQ
jgi:polyisoprenoid-binding protein YceI